jgi:hypothetical protein
MANLTDIADRLTPSVPIELTFGAQIIAAGVKVTTLFGHKATSGDTVPDYSVYNVINVGDPVAAKAELDAVAGANSQASLMAQAFVKANSVNGRSNFPAFRVVLLPNSELHFGPNNEAILAVQNLRSDTLVSCYPTEDSTNLATLMALQAQISGPDRDLQGQFGSFVVAASLLPKAAQLTFVNNSRGLISVALPDSNVDLVNVLGSTAVGSQVISNVSQAPLTKNADLTAGSTTLTNFGGTDGVYPGASVTGAGISAGTIVEKIINDNSVSISLPATATASAESLTVVNQPTANVYPGALVTGPGIPAATVIQSVGANSITISNVATAAGTSVSFALQNQISQPAEIVACDHAALMMQSQQPYNPLQNIAGALIPPRKSSDLIQIDPFGDSEALLKAGLSPYIVKADGTVVLLRTRTTYHLLPDGVTAVNAYFDWQDLVTMNDFREVCYQISQNPPFNNNPGGTKASLQVAALFKDEVLREAQVFEDLGMFQAVKTLAPQFIVAPSTTSRGRFDFKIPVNVLPGLYVIAGNIQGVITDNFTL